MDQTNWRSSRTQQASPTAAKSFRAVHPAAPANSSAFSGPLRFRNL